MAKYMLCKRDFLDPYTGVIHVTGTCFTHQDEVNAKFHVDMGTLEYAKEPEASPAEPEVDASEVFDTPAKKKHAGHK